MNKFAFVPQKKQEYSKSRFGKYIKTNWLSDIIKIWWLFFVLSFIIVIYLYYVTLASTRGYFLRKANQEHKKIEFQYEILKTDLLNYKQNNREKMHNKRINNEVVKIQTEIVSIPSPELTQR